MPMINLKCSREIPQDLLKEISSIVAESIGKPEKYVMAVAARADLVMSGTFGDAAYAEVKSIGGLGREVNQEITGKLCALLGEHLEIPADRIYVTFQSMAADHWGWNSSTFG